MDKDYFRSREFAIAALIAALLLSGGAIALVNAPAGGITFETQRECAAPRMSGAPLDAAPNDTFHEDDVRAVRSVAYTIDATGFDAAALDLCTGVGSIEVAPGADEDVHVVFSVQAEGRSAAEAVRATRVDATFAREEGTLRIAAWQGLGVERRAFLWGGDATQVHVDVRVPERMLHDVVADLDVGHLTLRDLVVGNLTLHTDVGDVEVDGVHAQGDVDLHADVGTVDARFLSLATSNVTVGSDVGEVRLLLPGRMDVGYDVRASADVGDVDVQLGDTDTHRVSEDGPGMHVEARSRDYAEKPVKVHVLATADVGSVLIDVVA